MTKAINIYPGVKYDGTATSKKAPKTGKTIRKNAKTVHQEKGVQSHFVGVNVVEKELRFTATGTNRHILNDLGINQANARDVLDHLAKRDSSRQVVGTSPEFDSKVLEIYNISFQDEQFDDNVLAALKAIPKAGRLEFIKTASIALSKENPARQKLQFVIEQLMSGESQIELQFESDEDPAQRNESEQMLLDLGIGPDDHADLRQALASRQDRYTSNSGNLNRGIKILKVNNDGFMASMYKLLFNEVYTSSTKKEALLNVIKYFPEVGHSGPRAKLRNFFERLLEGSSTSGSKAAEEKRVAASRNARNEKAARVMKAKGPEQVREEYEAAQARRAQKATALRKSNSSSRAAQAARRELEQFEFYYNRTYRHAADVAVPFTPSEEKIDDVELALNESAVIREDVKIVHPKHREKLIRALMDRSHHIRVTKTGLEDYTEDGATFAPPKRAMHGAGVSRMNGPQSRFRQTEVIIRSLDYIRGEAVLVHNEDPFYASYSFSPEYEKYGHEKDADGKDKYPQRPGEFWKCNLVSDISEVIAFSHATESGATKTVYRFADMASLEDKGLEEILGDQAVQAPTQAEEVREDAITMETLKKPYIQLTDTEAINLNTFVEYVESCLVSNRALSNPMTRTDLFKTALTQEKWTEATISQETLLNFLDENLSGVSVEDS